MKTHKCPVCKGRGKIEFKKPIFIDYLINMAEVHFFLINELMEVKMERQVSHTLAQEIMTFLLGSFFHYENMEHDILAAKSRKYINVKGKECCQFRNANKCLIKEKGSILKKK